MCPLKVRHPEKSLTWQSVLSGFPSVSLQDGAGLPFTLWCTSAWCAAVGSTLKNLVGAVSEFLLQKGLRGQMVWKLDGPCSDEIPRGAGMTWCHHPWFPYELTRRKLTDISLSRQNCHFIPFVFTPLSHECRREKWPLEYSIKCGYCHI